MIKEKKEGRAKDEAEEVKEILAVVSTEIPALIKGIVGSIFSEEAGKNMGRAAAAFYTELKDGGMPENVAVKMTENYIGVFTSLGDVLKGMGVTKRHTSSEIQEKVKKRLDEKLAEKTGKRAEST
ncbi:hypothetical protein GTO27_00920 [Candidatus Bathyarchaeota archaeon]|nr:hypothetical protein [Candidatus Bathyarchaeota archaeon]